MAGIELSRVVALVGRLGNGQNQFGTGFLVAPGRVLTTAHCTRDMHSGQAFTELSVVRASGGAPVTIRPEDIVLSELLDLAVVTITARETGWHGDITPVVFGRVRRTHSGILGDCEAIGYPRFQHDPIAGVRASAEMHGTIYFTDEAEKDRLLIRDPTITPSWTDVRQTGDGPLWGGYSGALVFHSGRAIGVVVQHHPRQAETAIRLVPFDALAHAHDDAESARLASILGVGDEDMLPWVSEQEDPPNVRQVRRTHAQPRTPRFRDPHANLSALRSLAVPGTLTAVVGQAGVGKSRLVAELFDAHSGCACHDVVVWLDAQRDLDQEIADSLAAVPELDRGRRGPESIRAAWDRGGRWLVVIDNVGDPSELDRLAGVPPNVTMVVTSRSRAVVEDATAVIDVAPWVGNAAGDAAGLDMLREVARRESDPGASALARRLGGLPLFIRLAGRYCARSKVSFADYMAVIAEDAGRDPIWRTSVQSAETAAPGAARVYVVLCFLSWGGGFGAGPRSDLPGLDRAWLCGEIARRSRIDRRAVDAALVELDGLSLCDLSDSRVAPVHNLLAELVSTAAFQSAEHPDVDAVLIGLLADVAELRLSQLATIDQSSMSKLASLLVRSDAGGVSGTSRRAALSIAFAAHHRVELPGSWLAARFAHGSFGPASTTVGEWGGRGIGALVVTGDTDDKVLVAAHGGQLRRWRLLDSVGALRPTPLDPVETTHRYVNAIVPIVLPTGRCLLVAGDGVTVHDEDTGELLVELVERSIEVRSVAVISTDPLSILVGHYSGLRVATAGQAQLDANGFTGLVHAVSTIDIGETTVLLAARGGELHFFDTSLQALREPVPAECDVVYQILIAARGDDRWLVACGGERLSVLDTSSWRVVAQLHHRNGLQCAALVGDEDRSAVVVGATYDVECYELPDLAVRWTITPGHASLVEHVAAFAAAGTDINISCDGLHDQIAISVVTGAATGPQGPTHLAYSHHSGHDYFIAASDDGEIVAIDSALGTATTIGRLDAAVKRVTPGRGGAVYMGDHAGSVHRWSADGGLETIASANQREIEAMVAVSNNDSDDLVIVASDPTSRKTMITRLTGDRPDVEIRSGWPIHAALGAAGAAIFLWETSGRNTAVEVLDEAGKHHLLPCPAGFQDGCCLAVASEPIVIAVGGVDRSGWVAAWDLSDSRQRWVVHLANWANVIAVGRLDGAPVALCAGIDRTLRIIDVRSGAVLEKIGILHASRSLSVGRSTVAIGTNGGLIVLNVPGIEPYSIDDPVRQFSF